MSEEINVTENKETKDECKCFCRSKGFRKFLITALGTFVGVYCALFLFTALHRPPMMPPMGFGGYPMPGIERQFPCNKIMHHNHFKHEKGNYKMIPNKDGQPAPFEAKRPEIDD